MNALLFPLGTAGDVYPFVGLGATLRRRGHDVAVVANAVFRTLVEGAGLEFVELGTRADFEATFNNPLIWHPRRGYFLSFREVVLPAMRMQYDVIARRHRRGEAVIVDSTATLGTGVAHEALGVPLVTVHLQPHVLWSAHRSPVVRPLLLGDWVPRALKRWQYRLAERLIVSPMLLKEANAFRAELGLAPLEAVAGLWHSPQRLIGMFPEWYAPRQPDWPAHLVLTGFPRWDDESEIPRDVAAFLNEGEPPVLFTAGTGMMHPAEFFVESVAACRRLGRRAILLTQFGRQVPADLPDTIRHFEYVPFGRVMARVAAVVHHGGIGTLSHALAAGVPQLVRPMSYDQPDNAVRLVRLGVAESIRPASYRAPVVARALSRLLSSPSVERRCTEIAARFAGEDSLEKACDAVEQVSRDRATSAA